MNNREEVAKNLRRIEEDVDYETAFMEIDTIIGTKDNYSFSFFFNRLANLIDPTCKPVEAGNNIVCSECGADLYDDDLYCPHCGARVVRGLETLEQVALPADGYIDN